MPYVWKVYINATNDKWIQYTNKLDTTTGIGETDNDLLDHKL